jgi:hypothetical protein
MPCERCRGLGRVHHGGVLTITDLRGRHLHLNWRPGEQGPPAAVVATYPSGVPVVQLAAHYRVGRWASHFGVRPEDLTGLDGEQVIGQHLRDGIVDLADPTADPVRTYLIGAVAGRPAGRILLRAHDWAGPSLADLARVTLGLGLALDITAVDHRHNTGQPHLVQGLRWAVELVDPGTPIGGHGVVHRHGVAEAVAYCLRYLGGALRSVVPAEPDRPVPIPQRPVPAGTGDGLADLLGLPDAPRLTGPVRRLAAGHPGQAVTGRLDATGYRTAIGT